MSTSFADFKNHLDTLKVVTCFYFEEAKDFRFCSDNLNQLPYNFRGQGKRQIGLEKLENKEMQFSDQQLDSCFF